MDQARGSARNGSAAGRIRPGGRRTNHPQRSGTARTRGGSAFDGAAHARRRTGRRDHAQQEASRTRVERVASAVDDPGGERFLIRRRRPALVDRSRPNPLRDRAPDAATPSPPRAAHRRRSAHGTRVQPGAGAVRAGGPAWWRAPPRRVHRSRATPAADSRASRRDASPRVPRRRAADVDRGRIQRRDIRAHARQRLGVADLERQRRPHGRPISPRSAPRASKRTRDGVEHAVHEGGGRIGAEAPREFDRLVDRDRHGYARPAHLEGGEAQHVAIDGGHPLDAPVGRVTREHAVDRLAIASDADREFARIGARALGQLEVRRDRGERLVDGFGRRRFGGAPTDIDGIQAPGAPPAATGRARRDVALMPAPSRCCGARCAISITASAASAPLLPWSPPARASAWASSSVVSTPKPTGTPVSRMISRTPSVTARHTYSKCGVPPRITTPRVTTAS